MKKTTPVVRLVAAFLRVADLPLEQAAIAVAVAPSQNPINALSWSTSTSSLRFQTMSVAVRVVHSTYTDSSVEMYFTRIKNLYHTMLSGRKHLV